MHMSDLRSYYSAFNAPNGTFGGWLFSAVPNAVFLADQCFAQMYGMHISARNLTR